MSRLGLDRRLPWVALAGLVLPACVPVRGAEVEAPLRVISPADRCVLPNGKTDLLCTMGPGNTSPPALRVDGKRVTWEPYEPPVSLAHLELAVGLHRIAVGGVKLQVYVRGDGEPPAEFREWPVWRAHPGSDCAACHEVTKRGESTIVGERKEPAGCLACHTPQTFETIHFHTLRPLSACHLCHAVHGSSNRSLLTAPAKTLCSKCHDS